MTAASAGQPAVRPARPSLRMPPVWRRCVRTVTCLAGRLPPVLLALGALFGLAAFPGASAGAELPVASVVGPPAAAAGASVPFIVSVDPPPDHRTDVLVHLSAVGAGAVAADLGRRSLAVGASGYAQLAVATEDGAGVGSADGQIRAVLIGDGHTYRASRAAGTATTQIRNTAGPGTLTDLPIVSVTAPRSVGEGAAAVVLLSASPLPAEPVEVELTIRRKGGRTGADGVEETRTLTLGRDGFAQLSLATEDDGFADPDGIMGVEILPSGTGAYRVGAAASVRILVLDDDWAHASNPYPTLSIAAPPRAAAGVESAFIIAANPPPQPGGSIRVPLRFAHESVVTEADPDAPEVEPLTFAQTGGADVIEPRPLGSQPTVEIWEDGLARVSFTAILPQGVAEGLVSAALVASASGAYRVSEGHGQAAVRIIGATGAAERALPEVSIRAQELAFEGQRARFQLFANPVPQPNQEFMVTVRVARTGGVAEATGPGSCRLEAGVSDRCEAVVAIDDDGWGLLEMDIPENEQPGGDGRLTATVLEPVQAAYRRAEATSLRSATVRVIDDDGPPPPLPAVSITAPEEIGEGGQARFLLTANPRPEAGLPVRLAITQGGGQVEDEHIGLKDTRIDATTGVGVWSFSTRADDGQAGSSGWVRARLLRDDADPYRLAGTDTRQVRIRDNGASPATPRLSLKAPRTVVEGGSAVFLLTAVPPPATAFNVQVVVSESGAPYLAEDSDYDAQQRSVEKTVEIPVEGTGQLSLDTANDEADQGGGTLTGVIQASASSPPAYRVAAGRASLRVQDDDAPAPAPPPPPSFSVRPIADWAPAGSHAHFLLTADRKFDTSNADNLPSVRMVIRAEGEAGIDLDRQRLVPLSGTGGCDVDGSGTNDSAYRYAALRDPGLAIPESAIHLCVPTQAGDRAVRLTLGDTFDNDNYRIKSPTTARITVRDEDQSADPVPVASIIAPPAVAAGAVAEFIVSWLANPPSEATMVRLQLSGLDTGVERLTVPTHGFAPFSVIVPSDVGPGHVTATLVEPPDGSYRADPNSGSARVAVVDVDDPLPVVSITAPPTAARGGASAFLLSARPAPAQPIAATVVSSAWQRIVPMDRRGVALLAVGADGDSPFETDGVLRGCLRSDPSGLYRVAGRPEEACASIEILERNTSESTDTLVSLTGPSAVGGGGGVALLLSADPPPGPSGVRVQLEVASSSGTPDVLAPGEAGLRTGFVGPDGIGFVRVRTQNRAGRFSVSLPAAAAGAATLYRRDAARDSVAVAVRAVGDQKARLPTVSVKPGPATVEGGTVEFTVASVPATPGLMVGYRLSGSGLAAGEADAGRVVLDNEGSAVVRVMTADDRQVEPDGALTISLQPGDRHRIDPGSGTATVRIVDDDAPADAPRLSLAAAKHAAEGAPARFLLSANPPPKAPAVVAVEIGQQGRAVADGRLGTRRLTLPASGHVRFSVPTLDNAVAGRDGAVTAKILGPVPGLRIASEGEAASVAVVDDDGLGAPRPEVSLLAPSAASACTKVDLDIVANGRPSNRLRVRISLDGAGSLHPNTTVKQGWARLDGDGQAVLPLWLGVTPQDDCKASSTVQVAPANGASREPQAVVRIMEAAGYKPSSNGGAAAVISVRGP